MQIKHLTASKRLCEKQGQLLAKRFLTLEKQLRWTDSQGVVRRAIKSEHRKGAGRIPCKYYGEKDCDYSCDESQAGGFNTVVKAK